MNQTTFTILKTKTIAFKVISLICRFLAILKLTSETYKAKYEVKCLNNTETIPSL